MEIEPGTQIAADGLRYPTGTGPTDVTLYQSSTLRVTGAPDADDTLYWDGSNWVPAEDLGDADRDDHVPYRIGSPLDDWLAVATTDGPTDVVIIGDSFGVNAGLSSIPWLLDRMLRQIPEHMTASAPGFRYAENAAATIPQFDTWGGAANTSATAGSGGTLSTGQKGTLANPTGFASDGLSVLYRTAPGNGDLIIRDGVGGTVLATIDTDAAAGLHRWVSNTLASSVRTFEFEASGGSVSIDGAYAHRLNLTGGIRVWPACQSGLRSDQLATPTYRAIDLVELLADEGTLGCVIIMSGTNDNSDPTTGANQFQTLVEAVQAVAPAVTILTWTPMPSSSYTFAEAVVRTQRSLDLGLITLDGSKLIPDGGARWTVDGLHPDAYGSSLIATHMAMVLSGDPLGFLLRQLHDTITARAVIGASLTSNGAASVAGAFTASGGMTSFGTSLFSSVMAFGSDALSGVAVDDSGGCLAVYLNGLSWLGADHGSGLVWAGRRQQINSQTGTGYTVLLADQARVIIRANAGASTMTWPIDSAQAIPIGTQIPILNNGAGTITHSCPGGTITGTLTQAQNVRRVATKTAANTWFVA